MNARGRRDRRAAESRRRLAGAIAYCLCLYGGIAYVDRRRRGQTAAAVPFGVLAVLGATVFVAALVLGLVIMTSKG